MRLFSVISRTLFGGILPLWREAVSVFCSPSRQGNVISIPLHFLCGLVAVMWSCRRYVVLSPLCGLVAFMWSCRRCIDASMLSWMLASPLASFFLVHTVYQHRLWDVKPYISSWVFSVVHFRMVPSILHRGQPRYLSFWWYFCNVVMFQVVFSFFWSIPLPIFPSSFIFSERSDFFHLIVIINIITLIFKCFLHQR